jgi:hypothetical protein
MHPSYGRLLTTALLCLGGNNVLFAQTSPEALAVARSSCAAAATQYALQSERYSDALKLMYHQTKDNPGEQAQRLQEMQAMHDVFKSQALQTIPGQADNMEADAINRQVQTWVIEQLWTFAKDKYGQDKLFFKFYINNRCKERFANPR